MTESLYLEGDYLKNNPDWHVEDSSWKAGKIIDILTKNKITPSNVCEIGCGAGEILNQLYSVLPATSRFVGYDIAEDAIDMAKSRTKERLRFKKHDLLMDDSAKFDLLLVIDVFEHIEDYLGFLRKCRNKAEYKIFHIPLDMSVQKVLRKDVLMHARQKVGHLHYFTRETALDTLKDAGYEVIDSFYTPWGFEMQQKTLLKKLFQLPLKIFYSINADLAVKVMGGSSLIVLTK